MTPAQLKVLSYVSGLPEPKRSNRMFMVLQAFIDDSKTGDINQPGAVFCLAGYISSVEEWLRFSNEWQQVLDGPPKIERFKMSTFVYRNGFSDKRLGLFRKAIERNVRGAVSTVVEMDTYRKFVGGYPPNTIQNPYYLALLDMVIQLKRAAPLINLSGKIEFFFDEQIGDKDHIKEAWAGIKFTRPDIAEFIGNEPHWENEEEFLPLQAADKLAWWTRRHRQEEIAGKPLTPFPWETCQTIPQVILELDERALNNIFNDRAS